MMEMTLGTIMKKVIVVAICSVIILIIFEKKDFSSSRDEEPIGTRMQEDIDKQRGSEFGRNLEKIMIKVVGWMPEKMFAVVALGLLAASILELFAPSGPLSKLAQNIIGKVFDWGIIGLVLGCAGTMIWACAYALLFIPILIVDLFLCFIE